MRNRRTAVLGGSGFIGRYIVKRLAARGEVVTVGCRHAEEAKFLKPMGDVGQIVPLNVAIGDERLLPAFLAGNDALVNCVGILRESRSQTFELAHHIGPGRLAGFARDAGAERIDRPAGLYSPAGCGHAPAADESRLSGVASHRPSADSSRRSPTPRARRRRSSFWRTGPSCRPGLTPSRISTVGRPLRGAV